MMKQLVLDMGLAKGPSLANFCVGPNAAALEHLTLWLGQPGSGVRRSPVPTYLWGGSGCGKTHLLQALRSALSAQGLRVGWLDATVPVAAEYDEGWAAVLMDDVHAFDGRQQQAAFNWFVNAQTQQVAVLAAGSLPPADLKLRDDLRTRLGWGLVYQVHALSDAEKTQALQQHALARGFELPNEVTTYLLRHGRRDLPALLATLDALDDHCLRLKRGASVPLLKEVMRA